MKNRGVLLAAFALLGLVAVFGALQLRVDFGLHRLLNTNASELAKVQKMHDQLPWERPNVLLALTLPRELTREDLRVADRIASELVAGPHVHSAISLAQVPVVVPGRVLPQPFLQTVGEDQSVREAAWAHPLLRGTLISEDGRTIVLPLNSLEQMEDLRGAAESAAAGFARVRLLGSRVVLASLGAKLERGLVVVVGLEILCFLLLLPLLFRTLRGSVLPLAVVLVALLLNFGWMGYFGYGLTVLDVAIPGLVLIIGLCDTIHLIQRFEEHYARTGDRHSSVDAMLQSVGRACFYTSFTTGVGFLSLVATDHETVSAFGLKAAVSVVVTFGVVILLLPLLLRVLPLGRPRNASKVQFLRLGYGRPRLVGAIFVLSCLGVGFGLTRVSVDSFLLEELPASDRVSQELRWYENAVSGILDIEARVEGAIDDPRNFAALERMQERMLEQEGITRVESITLFVREALGNPKGPLSAEQIGLGFARLQAASSILPTHLVDDERELARIVFKSQDVGVLRMNEYRSKIVAFAAEMQPGLAVECAGYVLMANRSTSLVVRAMLESLAISTLVIAIFLAILLRSLRLAIVALLCNLLPLAVALGLSGILGIHITIGSAVIYCLGLGLAVDDSIHILSRYEYEKRVHPELSKRELLGRTLRSSGTALILTSAVLVIGTLCHLAASFRTLHNVGILLSAIVVAALAVDLWVLPFLVERFDRHGDVPLPQRGSAEGSRQEKGI